MIVSLRNSYLWIAAVLSVACGEAAQESAPVARLAATVNGEAIDSLEIDRVILEGLRGREIAATARPQFEAETLARLVDQRLVAGHLNRLGFMPKEPAVTAAISALRNKASIDKQPFAEFLSQRRMTEASLRRELAWRLGWQAYVDRELNDAALEQFFNLHRRHFDGSQVRVSHILWRVDTAAGIVPPDTLAEAHGVRKQLLDGTIRFPDAARKYSSGPSKQQGGDIGFIPRHGQMDEKFSQAAFALEIGQISEPVISPFGVHLIQCTDIRPGERKWTEVRDALRTQLSNERFRALADKERPQASIQFSGQTPYFKPGTRELVMPDERP